MPKGKRFRVLSLFSGCGGMDLGFEGGFIAHRKSVINNPDFIIEDNGGNWVRLKPTLFHTVFANDILSDAHKAWINFLPLFGCDPMNYHTESIVDLVKLHRDGCKVFPKNIDVVTGGFPCQDFSVAGKRNGFNSHKDHMGKFRDVDECPTEESRGKLYFWMKEVVDITRPKVFIAENVKGLVNLGSVKDIIQRDFSTAGGNGYIVLNPQVLHAGNYGVPESRERVIFVGIRKDGLRPEAHKALMQEVIPADYNPYPTPTHACTFVDASLPTFVSLADVFEGLPEPQHSKDPAQQNFSKAKYMGAHCQGQKEIELNKIGPTIRSEHHGNIEFRRLSAKHGGLHISELEQGLPERRLTPRECALIQTFPPDYPFVFKNGHGGTSLGASGAYKVIGNAVPPMLAYNIAMRLQTIWDKLF
ncbi:MAG: DNA (cytosine-5-)-methyltransferase [Bacteroidales bacterium]|nr:DNA (cytosine-5-)-methyltransferase [Bacteroidales bacterium]